MEYLQFGFAAVFCVILYTDQRKTIRNLTRSICEFTKSVAELMSYIRENTNNR